MDQEYVVDCQFVSAGNSLKQWDLVKPKSSKSVDYDVYKSTDTEFVIPTDSSLRQPFTSVVYDPSGEYIASLIINSQELYITTLKEGMGSKKITLKSPQCITYIGLEGKYLAVGCIDSISIVDTKILKVIDIIPMPKSEDKLDKITSIESSYDSLHANLIVIVTEIGKIYTFLCFHDKKISKQINTQNIPINIVRLSPHIFNIAVTAHCNGDVNIWDLENKLVINSLFLSPSPKCVCIDFSPFRDDLLGVGNVDGLITVFDFKKFSKVAQFNVLKSKVTGLIFLKNGVNLIVGDDKGQIHIYNLRTLQCYRSYRLHSSKLQVLVLRMTKFSNITRENEIDRNAQTQKLNYKYSEFNYEIKDEYALKKNQNLGHQYSTNEIISPLRTFDPTNIESQVNDSKPCIPSPYFISSEPDIPPFIFSSHNNDDSMKTHSKHISSPTSAIFETNNEGGLSEKIKRKTINREDNIIQQSLPICPLVDSISFKEQSLQNSLLNSNTILSSNGVCDRDNIEKNYLSSLLESQTNDIKDFICQHMITLLSEITRNVTNLQLHIWSLDSRVENIQCQVNDIKKTISRNPSLL